MRNIEGMTLADKMVSRNIRHRRLEKGLSVAELGRCLGEHSRHIDAIETGNFRPPAIILLALAKTLKCKLSDFFVEESDQIFDLQTASGYLGVNLHPRRQNSAGATRVNAG